MHPYILKYHKNNVLLLAMVAIPVVFILVMLFCFFNLPNPLSEFHILTITPIAVLLLALALLWVSRTQLFVRCTVQVSEKGIYIKLKDTSFLYRRKFFFSAWDDISSISEMFDNHNGGYFYQIAFKKPCFVAYFSPLKNDGNRFFTEMQFYHENNNITFQLPLNIKLKSDNSFG